MDPDAALRAARLALRNMSSAPNSAEFIGSAESLAEHFAALDEWLGNGGFLPADWNTR